MMVSSVQLKQAEEDIRSRTIRLLQRHGILSRQEARAMLGWSPSGFSLHCDVRVAAEDRLGLERLTCYCARLVSFITDPISIHSILSQLELLTEPSHPRKSTRSSTDGV